MERADKNFKLGYSDPTLLNRRKAVIYSSVVTRDLLNIYDFVAISNKKRTLAK